MPRHKVTKFATMKNAARFRPEIEEPGKEAPKEAVLTHEGLKLTAARIL